MGPCNCATLTGSRVDWALLGSVRPSDHRSPRRDVMLPREIDRSRSRRMEEVSEAVRIMRGVAPWTSVRCV